MQRIIPPILQNDRGGRVYNLQNALGLLLQLSSTNSPDDERQVLLNQLASEQRTGVYGDKTMQAVVQFVRNHKTEFKLEESSGSQLNERIAGTMNNLHTGPSLRREQY